METKQKRAKVVWSVLALAGLVVFSLISYAGSLEPSEPPGPTMKTLDQVEPRIPISSLPHTISASGSYYITADLSGVMGQDGLTIEANDVTVDLMGHSLTGPDPNDGTEDGIYMSGRSNVEIRNGTVRDFFYGIYEPDANDGSSHRIINIRAISNGACGIHLSSRGNLVKNCSAAENMQDGISTGPGSTLIGNTAFCNLMHGIYVSGQCLLNENTAYCNNLSDGGYANISAEITTNTLGLNHNPPADYTAPRPNPSEWEVEPYDTGSSSISMTAVAANDISGVEYFFECKSGDCHDSGWQDSATYIDIGLVMGQEYSYTVRTRDKSPEQNEGEESSPWEYVTLSLDLMPPTPNPAEWFTVPMKYYSAGVWHHYMEAAEADDAAGVEYKFDCMGNGCAEPTSDWQDESTYDVIVGGELADTTYTVTYRDKSPNRNFGGTSTALSPQ